MLRAIGIGDNVIDCYLNERIFFPGGNSVNFAVNAKMLGAEAHYIGIFGDDYGGRHIQSALTAMGVHHDRCRILHGENGRSDIRLINGDRVITEYNYGGVYRDRPIQLSPEELEFVKGFNVIHTSCFSYMETMLPVLSKTGVPVIFDFSDLYDEDQLRRVCPHLFMGFISAADKDDLQMKELLKRMVHEYGSQTALATMGSRGALFYNGQNIFEKKPYFLEKAVDTLGAGDSFVTGFVLSYLEGQIFKRAILNSQNNLVLSNIYQNDYEDHLISFSMTRGNMLAVRTCMVRGAFGFPAPMPDDA